MTLPTPPVSRVPPIMEAAMASISLRMATLALPAGVREVGLDAFARSGLRRLVLRGGKGAVIPRGAVPEGCEWVDGEGKALEPYGGDAP